MKTLVLSNGRLEERDIENTLDTLQEIVGGYIEIPYLGKTFADNGIDAIINEEGKLIDGINPEIAIVDGENWQILDIVFGNCIFVSHNDEGETIGLNDKQIAIVKEELKEVTTLINARTYKPFNIRTLVICKSI